MQAGKRVNRRTVAIALAGALAVLSAGGAGGWFLFVRVSDPVKRAEMLSAQGDLRGALIELRNAVRARPDDGALRLQMGRVLVQVFEPVAAEKELRTARTLGVGQWVVTPLLGEALVAQGRWADVLKDVPRGGPSTFVVARDLLWRAIAQIATNDLFAAQTSLTLAREGAPDRIEIPLIAAYVARAQGDKAAAEAALDEVLRRDPAMLDALLLKREMLSQRGDAAGAMAVADQAVAAARWSPAARLERAGLLIAAGEDAKARPDVGAVLARFPRYPAAIYLDAVLLSRAGRFAEAETAFERLQPWVDDFPRAHYYRAAGAARLGNLQAAVDLAGRYHARVPDDVDGLLLLAHAQLGVGRADLAVPLLENAVAGGLRSAAALDLLGTGYAAEGNVDAAVETLHQAVAASREAGKPGNAGILADLAIAQLGQADARGALATLQEALRGRMPGLPEPPVVGQAMVLIHMDLGELDQAQQALDRLRSDVGETATVGVLAGQMLLARSDLAGAQAALLGTLKKFPDSAQAKVSLAKVLVLQGRQNEGERLLQEILAREPAQYEALTTMLQFLLQNDKYKGAIEAVDKARVAAPSNVLLAAMEGDLMVRSGEPKRAVALLSGLRDAGVRSPMLLAALGRAQTAAAMNEEAKATYAELVRLMPRQLEARRAQVALLLQVHEVDAAKAALREALAAVPGAFPVMSSLVALEGQTGGLAAALQIAADIRIDPANLPASRLLKGDALIASRRFGEAAEAYRSEYDAAPGAADAGPLVRRLATASMAAGQNDAAARALRGWLAGHGDDLEAAQLLARLDLIGKNYDEAATWLEFVLSRQPRDLEAINNLAWVYQFKGDKRARGLAQRAYLQSPTVHTADTLGWIMVQQGEAKAAVPLLRQAVQPAPGRTPDPALAYHLAVALKEDGKSGEAAVLLRPIIGSNTPFDDREAAGKLLASIGG